MNTVAVVVLYYRSDAKRGKMFGTAGCAKQRAIRRAPATAETSLQLHSHTIVIVKGVHIHVVHESNHHSTTPQGTRRSRPHAS